MQGLDQLGGKHKIKAHKQVISSAFGKIELSAVDAMVNFDSQTPAAWQKKWARNLQIKKKHLTSRVVNQQEDISDA